MRCPPLPESSLILLVFFAISLSGCDLRPSASKKATLPEDPRLVQLDTLPTGLEIIHTPNSARAVFGGRSGFKYTWLYRTSVRATSGPVTIEEFGAYVWHDGNWIFQNHTGEAFTPKNFAEWYSCPDALVTPGKDFADPNNWGGGDALQASKVRWIFIGVDETGNRVKGEAVIEQLAELAD